MRIRGTSTTTSHHHICNRTRNPRSSKGLSQSHKASTYPHHRPRSRLRSSSNYQTTYRPPIVPVPYIASPLQARSGAVQHALHGVLLPGSWFRHHGARLCCFQLGRLPLLLHRLPLLLGPLRLRWLQGYYHSLQSMQEDQVYHTETMLLILQYSPPHFIFMIILNPCLECRTTPRPSNSQFPTRRPSRRASPRSKSIPRQYTLSRSFTWSENSLWGIRMSLSPGVSPAASRK